MKKPHYAFIILLMCLWMYMGNMGLSSNILTTYLPFIEETGLGQSMGSALVSVRSLFSFLSTLFVARFYERLSLRRGVLAAGLIGAASALVCSMAQSVPFWFLGEALAGLSYGLGSVYPAALLLNNWFHTHRGPAVGVTSAGTGLTMMVFGPLFTAVILRHSLRTAYLLHAGIMVLGSLLLFLFVRDTPEEMGLLPYGAGSRGSAEKAASVSGASGPLSGSLLFLLAVMMLLIGGAGQAFSSHLAVLARSSGYSAAEASAAVSLFGFFLVAGKVCSGELSDRLGVRRASSILMLLFIAGCVSVLGMNGTTLLLCLLPSVILGFAAAVFNIGPPLWSSELAPAESYGKTLRFLQIFNTFGGIVFPVIPGLLAERTGEYKSSYLLFALMMDVSLMILLFAYHRTARRAAAAD